MVSYFWYRYPSDGGWKYHVVSSISEWIISTIFCFYILSFTDEFRAISIEHPAIMFLDINYNGIDENEVNVNEQVAA